jgi:LysM repeat protein
MKRDLIAPMLVLIGLGVNAAVFAQTAVQPPANSAEDKLEAISKKIDEQNHKIDLLSQEILKIEQQLANTKPGVMIGEGAPNYSPSVAPAEAAHSPAGNSHTVARGETLTSIAKQYNVSVTELQKFNHIENDRKLQIGQTLAIPANGSTTSGSPSPSPSPGTQ